MHTLIISIACSVAVSILLKIARRQSIDVAQAIAVNYLVAITLCALILQPAPASLLKPDNAWGVLAALGILLPTIFLTMAGAVRHAGIVLSDAAQRLSLFIPLIASFVLFGEQLSTGKITGISVALIALVCLLLRPRDVAAPGDTLKSVGFLLSVWVGYGVIDILFKQMAKAGAAFSSSLLISFSIAAVVIFGYLLAKRTVWTRRNALAGVVLGTLNFGNIYFYIRAHQVFPDNPTLVFSAMNIGVISLGTLVGAGFFKEKLSWINFLGIVLAISAIVILIPR
ncbi:MAG: EamA/RhaT family transporter [Candidimonas sp.]|jgi:drug/metabolite transporter (DMT)-like permease